MKTRALLLGALLPLLCGDSLNAQTWASLCTLDAVLVTFEDTTDARDNVSYNYHDYDLPYKYTQHGAPGDSSYKLADFERLFSGGYDEHGAYDAATVFLGDTVTVANSDTLPSVYGSLRAYFDSVSSGAFELHARLINPADAQGYPRWVELPHTKGHYAEINDGDQTPLPGEPGERVLGDLFWDEALVTAQDSVDAWYPNTDEYDIPDNSYNRERRLQHKVVYLYSGAMYTDRKPVGLLHPQVDKTTDDDPMNTSDVGYRYVMGEREGWGDDSDHSVDKFSGIGTHVHEFGHLLGFDHPDGEWQGTNPYTAQTMGFSAAHLSGWGSMQNGAHGPPLVDDNDWTLPYRSCPNPYNPFFRMDLGWNTLEEITQTTLNKEIEPGPGHYYLIRGSGRTFYTPGGTSTVYHYLLDFRTAAAFGQYTGWYQFTQAPGLLLWRRYSSSDFDFQSPELIPADGRAIFDARARPVQAEPTTATTPPYTYVWQDRLSDPFGATWAARTDDPEGKEVQRDVQHLPITGATDATHLNRNTGNPGDPGDDHIALRNIRLSEGGDHALVDIYLNYWSGPLTHNQTWSGTVYVGGDVTVPEGTTLTIESGTVVKLAGSGDTMGTGHSTTKAEMLVYGNLIAEGVTFTAAAAGQTWGGLVFYGDAVNHTTTSVLTGCTIEDALYGVRLRTVGWTVGGSTVEAGNTFRRCPYGVFVDGAGHDPSGNLIRHNRFEDCPTSIQVSNAFNTTIQQNLITGSATYGLQVFGARSDSTLVLNNTLYAGSGGGKGVYFSNQSAGTIRSTIASGFPQGGAGGMGVGSVTLDYYLSDNYGGTEMSGTVDSTRRALRSDPQFEDPGNNDYTLKADSPALDLGDPAATGLHANDGDRIDLGRYGGTAMADTASADLAREDYFYKGQVSGWTAASGASGSWSGDATQGTYKVTGVSGISKSYTSVDGSEYTLETRLKFSGDEGKVLYMQANNNETYRVDLMAVNDKVRLSVGQAGLYWGPSVTINANVWYSVRVQVKDTKVSVWLNGALIHDQVGLDATPDGFVGVGSYGSTHTAEVDYFLALQVADGASGGGGGALVEDQFNDGATDGWGLHSGTWSESGGHRTVSVNGEAVSYLSTGFDASQYPVYTVKVRLRMGGVEGKVVHRNANQSSAARVDLMSGQDQVRVIDVGWRNMASLVTAFAAWSAPLGSVCLCATTDAPAPAGLPDGRCAGWGAARTSQYKSPVAPSWAAITAKGKKASPCLVPAAGRQRSGALQAAAALAFLEISTSFEGCLREDRERVIS